MTFKNEINMMKTILLLLMTTLTFALPAAAQDSRAAIEQTIRQFTQATADRDVHGMHYLLHEHFRGMVGATALSKSDYMKMLGDRQLGGREAAVTILTVEMAGTIASAKIRQVVQGETVEAYCHLQRGDLGWQVLYVLPYLVRKT